MVQAWMQLLDLGMTPALGREVARLKSSFSEHARLATVVNSLETTFFFIAVAIGCGIFLSRYWIASNWLTFEELTTGTVSTAIGVMAVIISVRWISSINRSGVNAYEAQVWINVLDIIIATLRFPGSLALIIWSGGDILLFFSYQLVLALVEAFIIRVKLRSLLPKNTKNVSFFSFQELKRIAPFALSIGYTGAIWVLLTQLDKLLLSNILILSEYGYFTLIAIIASGLMMLSGPVSKAILPRMTALLASGREDAMLLLYRQSTRFLVSITAPITFVIATFPEMLVYAWTGDLDAAQWTAPVLPLFVIGNGLLTIIAFQYYLQYAHGYLRYHVYYNTAMVFITVPLIFYASYEYGAVGVGWVWLSFRMVTLLVWLPFIHHKFAPNLHLNWLIKDILPAVTVSAIVIWLAKTFIILEPNTSRSFQLIFLGILTFTSIALSMSASMQGFIRRKLFG